MDSLFQGNDKENKKPNINNIYRACNPDLNNQFSFSVNEIIRYYCNVSKLLKYKSFDEWMRQADYDYKTAKAMLNSGRYIYCVFMCHLSLEKALKAHYAKNMKENPPKTHNLNFLLENSGVELPKIFQNFIEEINDKSIPTRYPEDLRKLIKEFNKQKTLTLLNKTNETIKCLKK